jgi:hypothetical protein
MNWPRHQKTVCVVVLVASGLALAFEGLVGGCGNAGRGTAKVAPGLPERIRKGPVVPRAPGGKTRPEPKGIKERIRDRAKSN